MESEVASSLCCACHNQESTESLVCNHGFCSPCFARYLHGSIDELNRHVRCCVCGSLTLLTVERKREDVRFRFGRDQHPKLQHVTGITRRANGDYVFVDPPKKRILIFNEGGDLVKDFAYLYNYDILYGIAIDNNDRIVFPTVSKDSTNPFNTQRHVGLAYYNPKGCPIGFAFLDANSEVTDLVVTPENKIIVADIANSKLWFVHEKQRVIRSEVLKASIGELAEPKPTGLAVDKNGCYYVSDAANHCIKVYEKSGELKLTFGSEGQRPGELNHPAGLAVDENGRIIVADKHNHRVQIFNEEGIFERFIVRYNRGDDVYMLPVGISYLGNGEVAVLLRGEKDALVSEVRVYPCDGHPDVLSC